MVINDLHNGHVKSGYEVLFRPDMRIVKEVRKLPGQPRQKAPGHWIVPYGGSQWQNNQIDAKITQLGNKVRRMFQKDVEEAPEVVGEIADLPELEVKLPVRRPLYPYQEYGTAYLLKHRRVIIGDQPGLGKTSQAAAALLAGRIMADTSTLPALIICPATIKRKWQKELKVVAGIDAVVLKDKYKTSFPYHLKAGFYDAVIVNYESLQKYFVESVNNAPSEELLLKHIAFKDNINLFKTVIIDEIHRCKDYTTRQAKFVRGISEGKEWIFGLTGTPVVNRPADVMAQLSIIGRIGDFGGFKYFRDRYCGGGKSATNLTELNYRLTQTCFYRREKQAVLTDLPDKTRQVVLCDIDNRGEYLQAQDEFERYLVEFKACTDAEVRRKLRAKFMVQLGILCEISARGKLKAVQEWAQNLLESGEKVVIFCNLKSIIAKLKAMFPRHNPLEISGDVNSDTRDHYVHLFQNSELHRVIICNIKAGGVGIDLFASSNVGFIEFPWTFADCEQCEDRTHRDGQKNAVLANYFLGEGTVDEFKYEKIQEKKDIADMVTGAEHNVKELVDSLLNVLSKSKTQQPDAFNI